MAIIEYNLFEPNIAAEIRTSAGESQKYFVKSCTPARIHNILLILDNLDSLKATLSN